MSLDRASLLDIARSCRAITTFLDERNQPAFLADPRTQSAVLHQIIILGEATKRLSREYRMRHDALPWKDMAGMRDRLVHGYDAVDLDQVWLVATLEVPALLSAIEALLAEAE